MSECECDNIVNVPIECDMFSDPSGCLMNYLDSIMGARETVHKVDKHQDYQLLLRGALWIRSHMFFKKKTHKVPTFRDHVYQYCLENCTSESQKNILLVRHPSLAELFYHVFVWQHYNNNNCVNLIDNKMILNDSIVELVAYHMDQNTGNSYMIIEKKNDDKVEYLRVEGTVGYQSGITQWDNNFVRIQKEDLPEQCL